jgi:D-erythronate 2-dehydrogenase
MLFAPQAMPGRAWPQNVILNHEEQTMKLLITGGGGFVGARLARTLLARGTLAGQAITRVVLADIAPPPADLLADARVQARTGGLLTQTDALREEPFDGVFHLASAVSGECELDFDLGLRSNVDSTRALLDALRFNVNAGGKAARLVFSSSVAVFGPDPALPLPAIVADDTLPAPQTSYGTQKLICEHLVADYTRKGYIDGRAARLMTVTVRPGKPNAAASSFFSGIIREPLAGVEAICPVDAGVSHPVSSPSRTIAGLIAVFEASREAFNGRSALNLPALNVRVADMLEALAQVAGPEVRSLVRFERDERIAGIVANWPGGASAARAAKLGLKPAADFAEIVREYIADCAAAPNAEQSLKALPQAARQRLFGRD